MSVVNLNKARKRRAKADARKRADTNAARFGRSKAQKSAETRAKEQSKTFLDARKLDP